MNNTFIDDEEKMRDFYELTKEEFLASYSYLTEEEYDATKKAVISMYEYEINIDTSYEKTKYIDEWGAAYLWIDDNRGVEYNICIEGDDNNSAIYKMNTETDETYTGIFSHYEVNFDDPEWKEKLVMEMIRVANIFWKASETEE